MAHVYFALITVRASRVCGDHYISGRSGTVIVWVGHQQPAAFTLPRPDTAKVWHFTDPQNSDCVLKLKHVC